MKITQQRLKQIIREEKLRAIVESKIPYTKKEFYTLIESTQYTNRTTGEPGTQIRDWWELLDKDSIAHGMLKRAAEEYDEAQGKASKPLSMTKNQYLKSILYRFRTAGHKLNYTDTVSIDDHPARYSRRSAEDVIRRGYPEENLPSRKITTDRELNQSLSDSDKTDNLSKVWAGESEAYISPFGYVHAKDYKDSPGISVKPKIWVYVGNWFPYKYKPHYKSKNYDPMDPTGENIKGEIMSMEPQKLHSYASYGWPLVTDESLRMEREMPSPDRDALWGKGEFSQGTVDVQDPTMEESLISKIAEEVKKFINEV